MGQYTQKEREDTLRVLSSIIGRCENIQPKFMVRTSQHTLLKNRIQALNIAKALLTQASGADQYSQKELAAALPPISSIISKCEKAQQKFSLGSANHTRLQHTIKAMVLAQKLVNAELSKRILQNT